MVSTLSIDRTLDWTIYILLCADGTYAVGYCQDLDGRLKEIGNGKGSHFHKHPERLPVRVLHVEKGLPFREAFAKYSYLKTMPRRLKEKIIYKKKWPLGGAWKKFLMREDEFKNR